MDAQTGIRLKGKQIIQIPFQAQIRASQLLVRVVRPAVFLIDRPFVKKGVMDKTGAFFETWDSNGQNGCF